jgi:fatty-acyl-CoA synthase
MPTLGSLVESNAIRVPSREAMIDGAVNLSWSTLQFEIGTYAAALAEAGVGKGDRVAVVSSNSARYVSVAFAAFTLGAILVPVNTRLAPPELHHVLEDCDPRVIVIEPTLIDSVTAAVPEGSLLALGWADGCPDLTGWAASCAPHPGTTVAESDNAMIVYTSGTTGAPKGVVHTHHSAVWAALSQIVAAQLRDGERFLHIAPLHHAGGLVFLTAITALGGTHVLLPHFEPQAAVDEMKRSRTTATMAVPTVLQMLLRVLAMQDPDVDVSSWTRAIVGGSAMPAHVLRELFSRLPPVQISQICGQTESGPAGLFSTAEQMRDQPTASGHQAEPFIAARVVDDNGHDAQRGEIGELLFRGESVMKEYWRRPDETAATIRDGWLHTGDLVRVDVDGSFTLVDRTKDIIITGGRNVYSVEVEQALASHPDVLECAVIARPDDLWGESIVAVVNPRPDRTVTLSGIRDHCRSLIADYKLPHFLVLGEIPRNANGKAQKAALRSMYGQPLPKGSS